MENVQIVGAHTPERIDRIRALFKEYAADIKIDLSFQHFDDELARLPGYYAPPSGSLLLALCDTVAVGCVALRKMDIDICEMKRLFVRPEYRGMGIGKRLAREIINEAGRLGYQKMRLDSLLAMGKAVRLYQTLGFRTIGPYCYNPMPDVVFMEINLPDKIN